MYKIKPLDRVRKEIDIPPDKSISHRAVIISALASGKTRIKPFLISNDTQATLSCIRRCGVKVSLKGGALNVEGEGCYFPKKRRVELYAGESGTTFRIFSGVLCGQRFSSYFDAHPFLRKRPMARITHPLRMMGADIKARRIKAEEYPPFTINPAGALSGIKYRLPIPSAQVKSALLFASLYSKGKTQIYESYPSRNHTECMLREFGANIKIKPGIITLGDSRLISPGCLFVPSDFSSASFFIVLGLLLRDSQILIKNVNLNPTRCGLMTVLKRMGANIKVINKRNYFEPYGDILIKSSVLGATEVVSKEIPLMIDEVPIFCVAASFARGRTVIRGVGELKVKETDRINSLIYNLKRAGVKISAHKYTDKGKEDWLIEVNGCLKFKGAKFKSFSDHRTAMSAIILGTAMGRQCAVDSIKCIDKSFPEFISLLESLKHR